MKLLVLTFLLACTTLANPVLYSQLGDPLYAFAKSSASLQSDALLGRGIKQYRHGAKITKTLGAEADIEAQKQPLYLKELRTLKKSHDRVMRQMRSAITQAISANKYKRFRQLMRAKPVALLQNERFKQQVVDYYARHKRAGRIKLLDPYLPKKAAPKKSVEKRIVAPSHPMQKPTPVTVEEEEEKPYTNYASYYNRKRNPLVFNKALRAKDEGYDPDTPTSNYRAESTRNAAKAAVETSGTQGTQRKRVVILTTRTCPACKQAKSYLRDKKISFIEYDVNHSKTGRRLFRKNHGYAVPMFIIGNTVMTGLNPERIDSLIRG